jgi:hypothetical protein
MSMARFSPAASMKTIRLAIASGVAVVLFALGMSASPAKADQPHKYECSKNVLTLVIICDNKIDTKIVITDVIDIGNIDVNILSGKITGIDGDLTVVNIANVLNFRCLNINVVVSGILRQSGFCNAPS